MSKYLVTSFPPGVSLEGCAVARSTARSGVVFIRAPSGKMHLGHRNYYELDMLSGFGSSALDRKVYAKLAGIAVKDLEAARRAAKDKAAKENRAFELRRLKSCAAKLGMKLVKA